MIGGPKTYLVKLFLNGVFLYEVKTLDLINGKAIFNILENKLHKGQSCTLTCVDTGEVKMSTNS